MTHPSGSMARLREVMKTLLGPQGCPWDKEQTLESLRSYALEEAHEVVDAIDRKAWDELKEELGDLLLQVVFQSELAESQGLFTFEQVIATLCDKLIRRHPHVFADNADPSISTAEVWTQWEAIKKQEKPEKRWDERVPPSMPALLRALRLGEKAARMGFEFRSDTDVINAVNEEHEELLQSLESGDAQAIEHELGDALFSLVNLARRREIDPEAALRGSALRFVNRVNHCVSTLEEKKQSFADLSIGEQDALWAVAKKR